MYSICYETGRGGLMRELSRLSCLFLLVSPLFSLWSAEEYIYPLTAIEHGDGNAMVYVLHQKSSKQTELLLWDPATKATYRGLASSFSPAGFVLLPHRNGFSFIDEGRIRIKFFEKRAPRAIDLYEPLSTITLIHWLDESCMYLSAQKDGRRGIFQVSLYGEVVEILSDASNDYSYPCKVGDVLFYCRRSATDRTNKIMCCPYPRIQMNDSSFNDAVTAEQRMQELIFGRSNQNTMFPKTCIKEQVSLVDCGTRNPIFLHMDSEEEGFYEEHSMNLGCDQAEMKFYHCRLYKCNETWHHERLFSFTLPRAILLNNEHDRLYESILPCIPRKIENKIYFSSYDSSQRTMDVWSFDMSTKGMRQITKAQRGETFLSPVKIGKKMCYGGNINEMLATCRIRREKGKTEIDLPVVPLS